MHSDLSPFTTWSGKQSSCMITSPLRQAANNGSASKPVATAQSVDITKQVPAGIHNTSTNNYLRADGQNSGNFITDRPSTKVHSVLGDGSSLVYLFGDDGKGHGPPGK
ncbi:hypothetical protein FEM48_Zijuj04G0099800 [Ziziphus jujuba var. spinosa]|uniref:Protein SPIRAL1-like 1 n=1 Tax=Ziziphus jujuba var. spinosa TaxID=714518 RepID=A0A978VJ81_ZIZJJ|nr:hypothetical protein FEM48_Zijuj04G0099800 [Ziziphus jujuba var. spinosa]